MLSSLQQDWEISMRCIASIVAIAIFLKEVGQIATIGSASAINPERAIEAILIKFYKDWGTLKVWK